MTIKVIQYDETEHLIDCEEFEFRTNKVANWVKYKKDGKTEYIDNVCVFKMIFNRKEK